MNVRICVWLCAALCFGLAHQAFAAVGCELNDPDRDVKRFFPKSTAYKTRYESVAQSGGVAAFSRIESRLGDRFTGLYETIDVPYTIYEIYRGTEPIGYIHGVNQKGTYGGIQVFLALDMAGRIQALSMQKLLSKHAAYFRSADFARQFVGLSLTEFSRYDPVLGTFRDTGAPVPVRARVPAAEKDFRAILRGVKKNLILMDEFVWRPRT